MNSILEYSLGSRYIGSYYWFTQAGQAAVQKAAMSGDASDITIQSFMDYMDDEDAEVSEGDYGTALAASPSNVPGMGNAAPATIDDEGSGDTFGNPERIGIMSYKDYLEWLLKRKKKDK